MQCLRTKVTNFRRGKEKLMLIQNSVGEKGGYNAREQDVVCCYDHCVLQKKNEKRGE